MQESIYNYIKEQETAYDTQEIRVGNNWLWNMKRHIQMIFHLKNGIFFTGENNFLRAFKQVMKPVLNLAYWSQDIEVKDIEFYIEDDDDRVLSFLIKKYHDEIYVKENNLDTLIDEIGEEDIDYGGVLVQKGQKRPEVIKMPSIAFCDQTDILGGPVGMKFNFSPSKLRKMISNGWGDEANGATISIEELIVLAEFKRDPAGMSGQNKNITTGKNIEVYIVRGDLPEHYLLDNDNMDDYYGQVHIVGFYTDPQHKKQGVTLYRKKEKDSNLRFHTSKDIYGRALGESQGEDLLHPQVWTNFLEIHKMNMLEAGSKVLPYTDDDGFTQRQDIRDLENLEMSTVAEGKQIRLIPTIEPGKIQLFEQSINSFWENAQSVGSAFDPMLGKEQASGTTFRGQERVVYQGRGFHDRRRGQRSKFIEELYRDFIIPDIKKKILGGKKFIATLNMDEMKWVSDRLISNVVSQRMNAKVLNGEDIYPEDKEVITQKVREELSKRGSKHLFEILKDEFKDAEVKIGINVAGKQKNLAVMTDKILSIFQFVFSNPMGFQQVMQMKGMGEAFNDILEFSGISPVDFSELAQPMQAMQQPQLTGQQQSQVPSSLTQNVK